MKKTNKGLKAATMVAVLGTCFHSGGCSFGPIAQYLGQFLGALPAAAAVEFVLDNDGVFDLFEDGSTAANP